MDQEDDVFDFDQLVTSRNKGSSLFKDMLAPLQKQSDQMEELRLKDFSGRIWMRSIALFFFCVLILGQTIFVYKLVWHAFWRDNLGDLALIFGTLITGTLLETYLIVKEMIKWIFTDNSYDAFRK